MLKHVLRNSMIPIVTLFALDFAGVIGGGAILTETVFDLQGVGQYAARSVRTLDLPPIMAVTLLGAFFIVFFNAIVDFLYAYLDPRIRPSARWLSGCWRSRTSRSSSRRRTASSTPSTASRSRSTAARCSASSASPARARASPR